MPWSFISVKIFYLFFNLFEWFWVKSLSANVVKHAGEKKKNRLALKVNLNTAFMGD